MLKCFLALLASFAMQICAQKTHVYDFKSATWNTNGPRWSQVQAVMNTGIDVLAIQEAGSIATIANQLQQQRPPTFFYGAFDMDAADMGVAEYIWGTAAGNFYMYYYNNRVQTGAGTVLSSIKQNMAIVSRQRAAEIILIPNEVRNAPADVPSANNEERTFINRPALGIRIAKSSFFNIHPEPIRARNEAPALISGVRSYVETHYPGETWMVMGDMNRNPTQLTQNLPVANPGQFLKIVRSNANTHPHPNAANELDYCVVGGPVANQTSLAAIPAQLIQVPHTSDHKPVRFN